MPKPTTAPAAEQAEEQSGAAAGMPAGFVERRHGYRQSLRATAMLRPVSTAAERSRSVAVHVFNLSISGVGFSTTAPLEIGTVWRFDLCDKRQTPRRAEIRSCRPRRDGMFDVGAQFC